MTKSIFDTPTGRSLLIPQGARLIGSYDSQIPSASPAPSWSGPGSFCRTDAPLCSNASQAPIPQAMLGLKTRSIITGVSYSKPGRFRRYLASASEIGSSGTDNDIIRALRRGAGDTLNQTGQQVVRRNLNIQPTLTIRPGFPVG